MCNRSQFRAEVSKFLALLEGRSEHSPFFTHMLVSDSISKLYPLIRWWVSAASTVLPSLRHHKQFTRTPSHESKIFPSKS